MRDFTLDMYRRLLGGLSSVYPNRCYRVDAVAKSSAERQCVLRHDVDRCPANALNMARIEETLGIQATYYFRRKEIYNRQDNIRAVAELGHEIGYHYEVLAAASGDFPRARCLFESDLKELRQIAPVMTVAMHGSPLSHHNNMDVWQEWQLQEFGLIGEAFQVVDDASWVYLTDTGRSWASNSTNIRDHVPLSKDVPHVNSTVDLIDFVVAERPTRLCISAHPERWSVPGVPYVTALTRDIGANLGKKVLCAIRRDVN